MIPTLYEQARALTRPVVSHLHEPRQKRPKAEIVAVRQAVLDIVRSSRRPLAAEEIARQLGESTGCLSSMLGALARAGKLKRHGQKGSFRWELSCISR